jgi:hypothetical protein
MKHIVIVVAVRFVLSVVLIIAGSPLVTAAPPSDYVSADADLRLELIGTSAGNCQK